MKAGEKSSFYNKLFDFIYDFLILFRYHSFWNDLCTKCFEQSTHLKWLMTYLGWNLCMLLTLNLAKRTLFLDSCGVCVPVQNVSQSF